MHDNKSEWVIECNFSMRFNTEHDASIFYSSYLPEHTVVSRKRSHIDIHQSDEKIFFTIKSKDITAFRASINSILQVGNIVYKIIEKVDSLK